MISRRDFINVSARASCGLVLAGSALAGHAQPPPVTLLNVSYDPTRELYADYNTAFARYWKARTGQEVTHFERQAPGFSPGSERSGRDGLPLKNASAILRCQNLIRINCKNAVTAF